MKLSIKLIVIFAISICLIRADDENNAKADELKYNQKESYPNQWESPTNKTNLESASMNNPLLSRVLFEEDPKKKLTRNEFVKDLRFRAYKLTKGEAERIFEFADAGRDDLMDQGEWETFSQLYIYPFEACDKDGDYLLNEEEFGVCFDKEPKATNVLFRRRVQPKRHSEIMWAVTTRSHLHINFHDYLFIRRALYAWVNCHSNAKFISKNVFKCAMKTAVLHKLNFHPQLDNIYDVGLKLTNDGNLIQLDFIGYLRIMYSLYAFTSFGHPMSMPYLDKTNFLKAIKEDKFPSNFDENEVNLLYSLINTNPLQPVSQMNFETFAFFFGVKKLFNKYSEDKPSQLSRSEMVKLLGDSWAPGAIVNAIDLSNTRLKEAEYLEASLILKRKRPNEDRYYYSFLQQDASENSASLWNNSTVNNTYFTAKENKDSREVFFSSYSLTKQHIDKEGFYRAFQIANFFTSFVTDDSFVVPASVLVEKLMTSYNVVNPPISIAQRQNYPTYKAFPRELNIDCLTFLTVEGWRFKMKSALQANHPVVTETLAKLVITDFGMEEIPDSILDLSKKGFNNLRVRVYDPVELMSNCAVVQAVASENKRRNSLIKAHNIRENKDDSRKFPNWSRRAQASPYA